MSAKDNIEIKCPECGAKERFDVWQLINIKEFPNLKTEIFNQNIFRFSCGSCNKSIFILYPLIYHDEDKNLFIYFNPSGDFSNVIEQDGYITKTCDDYSEFLEIIKIFEDNIPEEKIVEAKNKLLTQFKSNEKLNKINKIYYAGYENNKISFYIPEIKGKVSVNL